jgi:hypothetical protein
MPQKNNFFYGFGLSLLLTAAVFGVMYLINISLFQLVFKRLVLREGTMMSIGLSVNMITVNYYLNRHLNNTAKGIMVFFLLCAAYIVYRYFGADLGLY